MIKKVLVRFHEKFLTGVMIFDDDEMTLERNSIYFNKIKYSWEVRGDDDVYSSVDRRKKNEILIDMKLVSQLFNVLAAHSHGHVDVTNTHARKLLENKC